MALTLLVTAQGDAQGRVFRYDFDDDRGQILLGRRGGVDVLLPHAAVAQVHARIERRPTGYVLVENGVTTGTWLNDARLEAGQERPLRQGDRVAISEFVLEVAEEEVDPPGRSESSISMARRMVAEVLGVLGPGVQHPSLLVTGGGQVGTRLELGAPGRSYFVGCAPGCDLVLADAAIGRQHARVRRGERGEVTVSPLGEGPVLVNDRPADLQPLRDGDVVTVGQTQLRFSDPAEVYLRRLDQQPAPPAAAAPPPARPSSRTATDVAVLAVSGAVGLAALVGLLYLWLG